MTRGRIYAVGLAANRRLCDYYEPSDRIILKESRGFSEVYT
jgi:hypothetical protein